MYRILCNYLMFVLACLFFLSGCLDVSSTDVPTELMFATLKIEGRADGTSKVTAEFNANRSNGDNVILENGDFATAAANGLVKNLIFDDEFLDIDYQAFFNTNAGNTEFVISLSRPNAGISAPNSSVRLPEPYSISTPRAGQIYSKNDQVYVSWTNAVNTKNIHIYYFVDCAAIVIDPETDSSKINSSQGFTVSDAGVHTFTLSEHAVFSNERIDLSKRCSLSITLKRENRGQLDPAYEGGIVKADQIREVSGLLVDPG